MELGGGVLSPAHLQSINAALADIAKAQDQAALATAAGIDVSAQVAALQAAQSRLLSIKQVYFPGL